MTKLYFAGNRNGPDEEFIREKGAYRLLSYHNDKAVFRKRTEAGYQTFLDSGAYSAWTRDAQLDVDEYIQFVHEYDHGISYYVQIDSIPGKPTGTPTKEEKLYAQEKTWENFLYMEQNVNKPEKLLPVFHYGSDFEYLERIIKHKPKSNYICLGALVGVFKNKRKEFFDEVFDRLKGTDIKVHALGMTDISLLQRYDVYSADSTTWLMNAVNGMIRLDNGNTISISDRQIAGMNHFDYMPNEIQKRIEEEAKEKGFTIQELREDIDNRAIFNIQYYLKWQEKLKTNERIKAVKQSKLF